MEGDWGRSLISTCIHKHTNDKYVLIHMHTDTHKVLVEVLVSFLST